MRDPSEDYLLNLTIRLAEGVSRLPAECRARHAAYLRAGQNADGGFSGREGGSDLYYTGFALRGLAVLDELTPEICDRVAGFLRGSLTRQASVVDFFSLLYSCLLAQAAGGPDVLAGSSADWPDRVAATLESLRTSDGGYAKAAGSASSSTYHTFLVALCYQILGRPLPRADEARRFIDSRRRDDGGFVEIGVMKRSGTNPTAAAVGLLQVLSEGANEAQGLAPETGKGVVHFLAEMPSPEGGLRANARAPLADLLSTFTGTWTLEQLGALAELDVPAVGRYVQALELPSGGFRGGLWDDRTDVEYTFYGLGCLALVST